MPILQLPLLKPYIYNSRGYVYKIIRCPYCGELVKRAHAGNELLTLDDPRTGNSHIHKCYYYRVVNDIDARLKEATYRFVRNWR